MIYLIIIGLPVCLAFLSDHSRGFLSQALFGLALFVPCLFAAFRDTSVGTDVMTYAYWTFYSAKSSSLVSFLTSYADISALGFNLISWILGKLGSFPLYLGVLQVFVIVPFCGYAKKLYPQSSWVAMALYMLLLFPFSLNAMKQMMAVALCVPSFELVKKQYPLRFCLAILAIAYLFHQTAIVALIYYPAFISIRSIGSNKAFFGKAQGFIVAVLTVSLFLIAFAFGDRIVLAFSGLKESYSYQVSASGSRLNYTSLVLCAGVIFVYLFEQLGCEDERNQYDDHRIFGLISIVGTFAVQLNMIASSLIRFSYYALAFLPLYAASLRGIDRGRKQTLTLFLILLCSAYFVQAFVINGGNQVYPYTSSILGIS